MRNKLLHGLLVFLLTACAVSPTGRQQLLLMNSQQINTMGVQAFNQLKQTKPIDTDPRNNAYVQSRRRRRRVSGRTAEDSSLCSSWPTGTNTLRWQTV